MSGMCILIRMVMEMTIPYFRSPYRIGSRGWLAEQFFTLSNFSGGLNNVEPDTAIADNEATDCRNMRFIGDSLMEKRPGTSYYDEASYADLDGPITWLDTYSPTLGDSKIVRATSTAVYVGADKICDAQGDVHGVTYIGKYYFVDGKSLRVYDGKKCCRIISEPVGFLAEAASANSSTFKLKKTPEQLKVGDHVLVLSSVAGTDEDVTGKVSTISENSVTISVTIAKALPKDSPLIFYDPGDKKKVIGEEVWDDEKNIAYYKPCFNEIADKFAGASYFPDAPKVITVHKDRLFVAGDTTQPHGVYMTSMSQPLYFPSGASILVKPDGEAVVDLIVFDSALIIGRHKDMFVLYGDSEYQVLSKNPFYVKQMDTAVGLMNVDCGSLLNNFYIYLGYDGRFYKLNSPTTYVEYLMTRPLPWKCDIYSDLFSVPQNTVVKTSSVAYRNEVYININDDLTIVYNYDNMAYTYYTGWKSKSLHALGIHLLIGRTDGKLVKFNDDDVSFDDLGSAINACYETKRFDLGSSINFKYFKSFMITSEAYDEVSSTITVGVEIDFYTNDNCATINSNLSQFGISRWAIDRFNNKNLYKSPYLFLDVKGRTIKYKFSNDKIGANGKGESFRIYDVNTLYAPRDVR